MTALRVTVLEPDPSGWHLIATDTELLPVGADLSLPLGSRELLIEEIDHVRTQRTKELQ